eukprot:g43085.t1
MEKLRLFSLEQRRLHGNLIEGKKIMTGLDKKLDVANLELEKQQLQILAALDTLKEKQERVLQELDKQTSEHAIMASASSLVPPEWFGEPELETVEEKDELNVAVE